MLENNLFNEEPNEGFTEQPSRESECLPVFTPATVIQTPTVKKKRPAHTKFAAMLICICMIGSAVFGFGGTYLANSLNGAAAVSVFASEAVSDTVLYQSVIKTVNVSGMNEKMSIEGVAAAAKNSVVEITTEMVSRGGRMGQFISTGARSGIIISNDGYIVTNNHVVSGAQTITVRLSDKEEYTATLIGTDAKTDLAVIKIEASDLQPAIFGNSNNLVVGETTIAIGNPLGELGGTVTSGIVSALDREITYGYVKGRIDTGLVLVDIQDAQTAMFYRVNKIGLYISKSSNGDFQSGDIITAVDGQTVNGLSSFNQLIGKYIVGDTVEITVSRSEKSMIFLLTLQELKS